MSDAEISEKKGLKPYDRPKIVRVSLRPEEAVLGHCKIPGGGGPAAGPGGCGILCKTFGS